MSIVSALTRHLLPDSLHKPIKCPKYSGTSTLITQANARHTSRESYLVLHNYAIMLLWVACHWATRVLTNMHKMLGEVSSAIGQVNYGSSANAPQCSISLGVGCIVLHHTVELSTLLQSDSGEYMKAKVEADLDIDKGFINNGLKSPQVSDIQHT